MIPKPEACPTAEPNAGICPSILRAGQPAKRFELTKEDMMAKHYVEDDWRVPIQKMETGDGCTTKWRMITRTDVELVALLGGDYAAPFLSPESAREIGFRDQILPGVGTLNIAYGMLIQCGFLKDVIAYMGTREMRFLLPVHPGDRIRMITEVAEKKRVEKGWICTYDWKIQNQEEAIVAQGRNT